MNPYVIVTVREGQLRGISKRILFEYSYLSFRGIPYAKPPIGDLRFKDPEPAEPWSDIRDATKLSNAPLHYDLFHKRPRGNEDCLYLNVYTKGRCIDLQTKRAVMVWIHGNIFNFSSTTDDFFGPDYIVRKDVVLVTINYRLGVFGFLNMHNEMAWGNQGLKDALMALRWIQDNISNFGGDPDNVTIFGQGFGGAMVHFLAICPLAAGLFHKVICQSGTAYNTWAFSDTCTNYVSRLIELLGIQTEDMTDAAVILKSIPAWIILTAAKNILTRKEQRQGIFPFVPTYDYSSPNRFFVEHPSLLLRSGVKVPFIIGFTTAEGSFCVRGMDDEDLKLLNSDFSSVIHPEIYLTLRTNSITPEDLRSRYFHHDPVSMTTINNYIDLMGDMHYYSGIFDTAAIQMRMGHRSTYMYHFSRDSGRSSVKKLLKINFPGSTHGDELFYLFYTRLSLNTELALGLYSQIIDQVQYRIIDQITQMWTDFAKTGNPTPAVTSVIPIIWTPLEKENEFPCLIIDQQLRMETTEKKKLPFFGVFRSKTFYIS